MREHSSCRLIVDAYGWKTQAERMKAIDTIRCGLRVRVRVRFKIRVRVKGRIRFRLGDGG